MDNISLHMDVYACLVLASGLCRYVNLNSVHPIYVNRSRDLNRGKEWHKSKDQQLQQCRGLGMWDLISSAALMIWISPYFLEGLYAIKYV